MTIEAFIAALLGSNLITAIVSSLFNRRSNKIEIDSKAIEMAGEALEQYRRTSQDKIEELSNKVSELSNKVVLLQEEIRDLTRHLSEVMQGAEEVVAYSKILLKQRNASIDEIKRLGGKVPDLTMRPVVAGGNGKE